MLRLEGQWAGFPERKADVCTHPRVRHLAWSGCRDSQECTLTSHGLPQGTAGPGLEKMLSGALSRWAQGPEETQVLVAPEAGRRWLWP